MAAPFVSRCYRLFRWQNATFSRRFLSYRANSSREWLSRSSPVWLIGSVSLATVVYAYKNRALTDGPLHSHTTDAATPSTSDVIRPRLTRRERRFVKFASVEHDGQVYMTPLDFIESVTENEPRHDDFHSGGDCWHARLKRRVLTDKDMEGYYKITPPVGKGSPTFFRGLRDQGVISYTEYLFLLSILTKPHSGFHIAFNMFDTDGNRRVDREEFLVLAHLVAEYSWKENSFRSMVRLLSKQAMERIFSYARLARLKAMRKAAKGDPLMAPAPSQQEMDEELLMDANLKEELENVTNTTILVHLFGKKGQGTLGYDDFRRFMENLQTEVLQIEFNEFSRGLPTISELDFAKILLRYTLLHSEDYDAYLDRLVTRIQHKQGITFEEFKTFCQFLNNLEDFGMAMRMYTLADRSISPEEFNRAVKICTGHSLSEHLVETVFQIFDEDDDGQLSYKEFIAIMRDRLHRGIKNHNSKNEGWDAFKTCIKEEMRASV